MNYNIQNESSIKIRSELYTITFEIILIPDCNILEEKY